MLDAAIPMQVIRLDYSSTSVAVNTFTQLSAALTEHVSVAEIFDSSGSVMQLGIGASGSEVALNHMIIPGGNGRIGLLLSKGCRLSIQAIDVAAATGQIVINLYR